MAARMPAQDLRSMLDRIRGIRHACDLDLLLFFYRHPRALLTSELVAVYLGYDPGQVAKSFESLIEAGLLTRSQSPSHAAQLYTLELGGEGPLTSLLSIASTREGRLGVKQLLQSSLTKPA